jgi:flagellar motor switch protein FliM
VTSLTAAELSAEAEPVDFRRPTPLGPEQTKAVRTVHDHLVEFLSPLLTSRLRTPLRLSVIELEMVPAEELETRASSTSLLVLIDLVPLTTPILLRMDMSFCLVALDLLLGGPGVIADGDDHLPTQVELQIFGRLLEHCMAANDRAWSELLEVRSEIAALSIEADLISRLPLGDPFLRVDIAADIGGHRHMLDIWMPNGLLTSALRAFEPKAMAITPRRPSDLSRSTLAKVLTAVPVQATVNFAPVRMTSASILSLSLGEVIQLGSVDTPLSLEIGATQFALVRPARAGQRTACQVMSIVDAPASSKIAAAARSHHQGAS